MAAKVQVKKAVKRKSDQLVDRKALAKKNKAQQPVEESSSEDELDSADSSEDDLDNLDSSDDENTKFDDSDSNDSDSDSDSDNDLDNSDSEESDGESNGDNNVNGQSQNEDGSNGKTQQESRAEQKKLREERKLQRPYGTTIQQIKKIWEKLRVKKGLSAKERLTLANEGWALAKDQAKDLVLKHDASRVIQTILKYSPKPQKEEIVKALRGTYYELSKSSYGKYLVVKMLHYGSKETRADIINELHGNFRKLMKHREGAYVIEDAYRDYATPQQKRQIIREFFGNEYAIFRDSAADKDLAAILAEAPEKRPILLKNLNGVITSAVNKGSIGFQIIHAAMLEYVKNIDPTLSEREEFIDLISEQFPEIVHTPEGSEVASRVLSIATAKERKHLVKSLKPFASKLATDENGQFVLITLLNTVDDTVMVSKNFTSDFKENLEELLLSKAARKPFMYLLSGRTTRNFSPAALKQLKQVDEWKKGTSKKDDEVRLNELKKSFSPLLLEGSQEFCKSMLSESTASQLLAEILLFADDESGQLEASVECVVATVVEDPELLSEQAYLPRVLRCLIQNGHWNFSEKKVDAAPNQLNFGEKLSNALLENPEIIQKWVKGEGAFVVVALIEQGNNGKLVKEVKKATKGLKESDGKGIKLLLDVLSNK